MKKVEEFAVYSLILLGAMTIGWLVAVSGLRLLGVI